MPRGSTGTVSPSPLGPLPPCGRCLWPYSPSGACCPPSVWALCPSGWDGKEEAPIKGVLPQGENCLVFKVHCVKHTKATP